MPEDPVEKEGEIRPGSKVGLSLSGCVKDILEGTVREEEVGQIISGTRVESPEEWDGVIENYRKRFWAKEPDRAEEICRSLIAAGKIRQPRIEGRTLHQMDVGNRWIDADQLPGWEKEQGW